MNKISTFFRLWDEQKQGFHSSTSRFQRNILRKNDFSLEKVLVFCYHFWRLSNFFVVLRISSPRCVKTAIYVRREKKLGKTIFEKLLVYQFRTLSRKIWTFSKTIKHGFQKCSLRVQRNNFRIFFWRKKTCKKVFGLWTERSDFLRKILLRVAKGAFHVSRATLWEKDDRSKLFCLWLLYIFAWLFFTDKRTSPGCQNNNIGVQSKIYGKIFCGKCFFQNFSGIEQRNLEI